MSLPSEDCYCRHFQPNTFDPSRCSACLRPGHMHLDTAPTDTSQEQELGDDEQVLSEVNSSASSDDIRDAWTYEWSLGRSLSPECELDICDTDTQSSSENNSESPQRSNSLNSERNCVTLGDMTRMDPSPLRGAGSPWMDERRGRNRSRRTSESRGVREQESGYFSPEQRTDGELLAEDASKRSYRYYERGHPLPNNYVPEPKASVPYRNVNLGIPSQRRNPETYMQDNWRSESPQRYSYHSNFRRGTETLRNSPTRHSSMSPDRHKRSDPRMRSLSRSETQSHGSSNLPSHATSQRTSSRSSPSRRRGSFASRTVSPSRLTPSHKHTESFFSQNGGYEAQGGCSRESKIPSQTSNKHSLDSERLYKNLESISRRASCSSTFQQNTNEGSQRSPQNREGSPSRNGSHSRISQRQPSSRDSRASASPGSWQGSSQSVLSIPISCGSSASRHGADHQGPGASPPLVAITETDNFSAGNTKISGDRSRSSVRRGMEALLLSEPKRAAQELEEVGMTMEDYIVLADIPTIHVESEDDYPGLRRRNQSPSPCRDQRFRTQSHQPQDEFYSWNSASDERGRGRERVRDRREKDSENGRLSQRQSTASLRTQSSDRQSGKQRSAKMTEQRLPDGPQTKMPATLKGWMSRLDENDKWRKHWFVLDDESLKYYRDPEAEESDDLDGEIDLYTCVNVSDWDVEKNFGLRIQTKRAVFTLSAVTSTLRRNWVTLLKQAIQNNTYQSESGDEKENPLSHGPSSCQPAARFTCSGFEPAGSNNTAEGLHPPTDADVHEEVSSDPQRKEEQEEGWDRDWAKRLEERNKWFEDAVPFSEVGRRWDCMQLKRGSVPVPVIDTMDSEVSRKWTEFERLSFKDMSAQSLIGAQAYQTITWLASDSRVDTQTCQSRTDKDEAFVTSSPTDCWRKAPATLNGSHTVQTNTAEALPKEARKQMESTKRDYAAMVIKVDSPCGPGAPCGAQLEAMEAAHRKEVQELQEQHERELSELEGQRDKMLQEERQASAEAMEALRAAHREELEKARRIPGGDAHMEAPCRGHVPPVDVWHSELDVLSERFSEKCLQLTLTEQSGQRRENDLDCKERELQQLWKENQELKVKLAEEISRMRYFITGQRPDVLSLGNVASDVETLLRAKENEVHSLKRQVSCLQSEVQSLTKEKEAAYERYKESYVELSDLRCRNRLEMDSLNEHLTLVDAARQERARESCEQ
ncbi:TRIO and F-actin-binding protein-like isoform X1 [Hippocampus comes]|nr:PREDICTED: TRIO and F-actin-binding protein-like isoform X1 [Hippocampus comes]